MQNQSQRLTVEQYIQITDWLKENKHRIHSSVSTQLEICEESGQALGFKVPITSIQRCGKIAGIKWPKSPPKPPPVPIEREAIIILIGAIAGLYVETGRTMPESLANLKTAYVQEPSGGDFNGN